MKLVRLMQVLGAAYVALACVSTWLTHRYLGGTPAALVVVAGFVGLALVWVQRFGNTALGWGTPQQFPHLLVRDAERARLMASGHTVTRFVCVSDTHGRHDALQVPDGDVLLHAGDVTMRGTVKELRAFNDWLGKLPHKHKLVVAGNHDLALDGDGVGSKFDKFGAGGAPRRTRADEARALLTNCTYIQDSGVTTVHGVTVYGTAVQPPFHAMAFNRDAQARKAVFDAIPAGTDIVLTHSPAWGWLDRVLGGWRVGDPELATALERVRPRYHVCGHIHESRGVVHNPKTNTTHINAANCTLLYRATQPPIVFDFVKPNDAAAATAAADAKANA